jgi:hypothetical protein
MSSTVDATAEFIRALIAIEAGMEGFVGALQNR